MKTILVDAVNTLVVKGDGLFQDMYELLESYPNRKIVLTNADDEQMISFGLDTLPYKVFTLKHNPEKTNPEYFETMLHTFGLEASDVVYFEHNQEAVASAESVGIASFWYDSEKQDLIALNEFLDKQLL